MTFLFSSAEMEFLVSKEVLKDPLPPSLSLASINITLTSFHGNMLCKYTAFTQTAGMVTTVKPYAHHK